MLNPLAEFLFHVYMTRQKNIVYKQQYEAKEVWGIPYRGNKDDRSRRVGGRRYKLKRVKDEGKAK